MNQKEIQLKDLFIISTSRSVDKNKVKIEENAIYDFIGRTVVDNGIQGKINKLNFEPNNENCFSVIQIGQTWALWRENKWYASQNIFILEPIDKELKNHFLYFQAVINKKLGSLYGRNYNTYPTKEELNELTILIPYDEDNNICYDYMDSLISELEEEYISKLEEERISELDKYLKVTGLTDYKLEDEDINILYKEINTKSFKISDLFDIRTGRDVIINTLDCGNIPLISHQCNNNGIAKYINNLSNRILFNHKSTIPLADRGVFHASCQTKDFYIGTRVKALIFKDGDKTENQRLYFVNIINRLQEHFSDYLTNATDKLPELVISLPIKFDGAPDYEYMENYITAIKKLTIKDVVEYKDKVINITKQIS